MIELTASGDRSFTTKLDSNQSVKCENFDRLMSKLNIPIHCFYDQQIRQHYLDEYTAKYSKAKHLLSNARRKQRKIIITYYEEKENQDDINRLQMVKESLLEENEKIKRFKEALKEKLIIYQQRVQFLKVLSENNESCNHLDNSCPTISDEMDSISLKQKQSFISSRSHTELISEIEETNENIKGYRLKIVSTILIIGLAVFIVILMNDLLEQFFIYLTKPSRSISNISPSNSMIKSFFTYLLSIIYNYYTTS